MRVLIPGIASPIARLVALRALAAGHEVIGIDPRPWPGAPEAIELHQLDVRKRAAEDVFRKRKPEAVIHMATVTHLVTRTAERFRINLGGTRAVFEHCHAYGVEHAIFVGRHTYYGAAADSPLYHHEDDPPMAVHTFPELADLVAADLYAMTALWRYPGLVTTVLRCCYSLGPTMHGTLAAFVRGRRTPMVLGFDPLFQFMHEDDVVSAIALSIEKRLRGVFNVAGPQPVPFSVVLRETGRTRLPLPETVLAFALGKGGLPDLPKGALDHLKFPIVVDTSLFREKTGFVHELDEGQTLRDFAKTFPAPR